MRQYFYDTAAGALIVLDTETQAVTVLAALNSPLSAPPPAKLNDTPATPEPVAKRKYKKRAFTEKELFPTRKAKEPNHAGKAWQNNRPPCSECGSKGSRHFKTCSKNGAGKTSPAKPSASIPRSGPISQMTFGRVKISQSHDVSPEDIARNLDIDVAEVEKAFECETYSDYKNA